MNKLKLVWALFKQIKNGEIADYRAGSFHKKDILYFQASKLGINNPDLAPFHIDGDPVPNAAKFSIHIIPKAFRLIQP
jgi:diacylglycerol kinase family enzyme